jgi:beta-alanine degradation protein BauB
MRDPFVRSRIRLVVTALILSACATATPEPQVGASEPGGALNAVVSGAPPSAAVSRDPVQVSPEVYGTRLENEWVRVVEMRLRPGATDELHSHPDEAVLFLTAGRGRITLANGQSVEKELAAGEVMWNEAWTHQVENIGESEIHAIIVELQDAPRGQAAAAPAGADPVHVSGNNYKIRSENERVRIIDLYFRPGEMDEMHVHPSYVAYFRTPANLTFTFADGRTGARQFAAGEVLWSDPTVHQVANAGTDDVHIWIVELKER